MNSRFKTIAFVNLKLKLIGIMTRVANKIGKFFQNQSILKNNML